MRRFYLHPRTGIYPAELVDPETGPKLTAKSTRKSNKDDALLTVTDWPDPRTAAGMSSVHGCGDLRLPQKYQIVDR
jgi:hypothetical protein